MTEEVFTNKVLKGTGVSSGITTGKVYLLERVPYIRQLTNLTPSKRLFWTTR